jgi:hypothetical protein
MQFFFVTIARYDSARGETRHSGRRFIKAASFSDAFITAETMINAMADADPDRKYSIHCLTADHNHQAIDCEGGIHAFETAEEFHIRMQPQAA